MNAPETPTIEVKNEMINDTSGGSQIGTSTPETEKCISSIIKITKYSLDNY
ncbi:MAG: hypothetical protein WBQ32_03580 [Ignavibacteriaceae bacterium]